MDTANKRLKAARERLYPTATAAAEALGVPMGTYAGHENGNRGFPASRAPQYARKFKVTEEWLLYGKGEPPNSGTPRPEKAQSVRMVPLIGSVPGGNWREAVRLSSNSIPIPENDAPNDGYALTVEGDSMDRHVPDGYTIVVDPGDVDLFPRRLYVVMNDDGEATFKEYREGPARLVPASSNPAHKEIPLSSGGYRILGRVVWSGKRHV